MSSKTRTMMPTWVRMRGDKQATRLTVKSSAMLDNLTISSLESLLCSDLL
ncbi:BnaCnng21760D [Brassica napus]|uniref:BnaCnng21760D protein n=1 Tax=Brassica napus TaxID=3708 RepID=A0A078ILY8_BRANA|nr:BnaCnng21760D [Brassica napus]